MYRDEARKARLYRTPEQLGWMAPIYVGETDERAREEARPRIETLLNNFLRMRPGDAAPARATLHIASCERDDEAAASQTGSGLRKRPIEDLIGRGIFVCRSAATVRES